MPGFVGLERYRNLLKIGDTDGHGCFGELTVTGDGRLLCHDCGGTYLHLATHLSRSHGFERGA